VEFDHLEHPYLDEETFSRNDVFWIGMIGVVIGWLAVRSFSEFVTVVGLWILLDMAIYAYRNDEELLRISSPKDGGENQGS